jgi:hypothetical protein
MADLGKVCHMKRKNRYLIGREHGETIITVNGGVLMIVIKVPP